MGKSKVPDLSGTHIGSEAVRNTCQYNFQLTYECAIISAMDKEQRREKWRSLVYKLGPNSVWLKEHLILLIAQSLSSAVILVLSFLSFKTGIGPGLAAVIALAVAILIATGLDAVADKYEAFLSENEISLADEASEVKASALNTFIARATSLTQRKDLDNEAFSEVLSNYLVSAACQSLSGGTRASFYQLKGKRGRRELLNPVHDVQGGRTDQSQTPFIEQNSPENTIWHMLGRPDSEPQVVECPDDRDGVNWEKVHYKAYYTVPVKCGNKVYGILSFNTDMTGSISASQQRILLGMARVYALSKLMFEARARR
ncbi:hypothetical protein [Glutamicibacter protophormiae]